MSGGAIKPTPEQQDILSVGLEPLRVAAGAGTGKTTTIALRVAHILSTTDTEPEQVLGLTFTNKAAAELADRFRSLANSEPAREVEVHTYHGFAAHLLREFGALVGIERDAGIITPTFSRQLILGVIANTAFETLDATNPRVVERIRRLGSELGDQLILPDQVEQREQPDGPWLERADLIRALSLYANEKRRLHVADYADLIVYAHRLVTTHPDIAERIAGRYRLVVLDEYQDTNPAQRELLRTLFPAGHPVMAVGDADQTIYEWRGASLENFAEFCRHFARADGSEAASLPLTLNRRSGRQIIDVANSVREKIGSGSDRLLPLELAPSGRVVTRYESNAVTEAAWISAQLASLHAEEGIPWRAMAILVRKNKDLPILHDALKVEGIPVEVANIGGLLAVAEVADVYAWLRLLGHPEDSPALLRILMGSRYRMGMADLRPLTDWASGDSVDEEHGRLPARSLLEAIDHLDPTNESAADLFDQFRREYRELLAAAQGVSLVELCRRILDRTGAWHDVEAMDDAGRLSARLNLHRFLDLTEDWSPLEGRPSLEAFLGYLTSMQDEDAEDLDAARLSGEDAVGLLTVHRAKGLEWDVVVLPALYQDNFPTKPRVYPNPHRFAEVLPYELRLDQKSMPDLAPGVDHEHAKQILGERHLRQEWRLAYVGVTRARRILIATGAHWYGTPEPHKNPRVPSELFDLIDAYPGAEHAGRTLPPPRPELLRVELSSEHAPDPLFEHGWDDALRRTIESAEYPASRAEQLGLVEEFKHELAAMQDMLFALPIPSPSTGASRLETSVTGLVTYAGCPKRFYWSEIDRLPRRPSRAARRGVAIHRRIEMFNRGQPALDEVSPSLYDSPGEWTDGDDPFSVFRSSRFADLQPVLVEAPFELLIGPPLLVRGRIDAIYEPAAGHWEVVDFKSGRPSRDPTRMAQLEAYAVAVADSGLAPNRPDQISVTFAYLGDRLEEQTHLVDGPWEMAARRHLEDLVTGIADGMFEPTPSEACTGCDFLRFCEAGRAHVGV